MATPMSSNERMAGEPEEKKRATIAKMMKTTTDNYRHCSDVSVPDAASTDASTNNVRSSQEGRQEEDHDDSDDECSLFAIDFMFEGNQPSRMEYFEWNRPSWKEREMQGFSTDERSKIQVALSVAEDDNPGALQSGHYLWPASKLLSEYLIKEQQDHEDTRLTKSMFRPTSVLELGAGCALVSLTALQLWQESLQCVIVTDHDPGVLERARNNYESTLQQIMDQSCQEDLATHSQELEAGYGLDDRLDAIINDLGSVPLLFESLEWKQDGKNDEVARVEALLEEHTNADDSVADCVLGSDLIYDVSIVQPLLTTAASFLSRKKSGARLVLAQSFAYPEIVEQEIDEVCARIGLQRMILWQDDKGNDVGTKREPSGCSSTDLRQEAAGENDTTATVYQSRIQEFRFLSPTVS